jgi:hypothetical protein
MPLLEVVQTRRISTSGGSSTAGLRIRTAATVDAAESPEREAHGGVEFAAPYEGGKRGPP